MRLCSERVQSFIQGVTFVAFFLSLYERFSKGCTFLGMGRLGWSLSPDQQLNFKPDYFNEIIFRGD